MRADSTLVREMLCDLAIARWWTEAPIWGRGTVQRGDHAVEYKPTGSRHTWYGFQFVKGAIALAGLLA